MTKLARKNLIPLNYQYGRDSEEIGMRLRLPDNRIIPRNQSISLQEIWGRLMSTDNDTTSNKSIINKILGEILSTDINESIPVSHDLLWYLSISEDPFRTGLNKREISYLMKCSNYQLEELIGIENAATAAGKLELEGGINNDQTNTEDLLLENQLQEGNFERRVMGSNNVVGNIVSVQDGNEVEIRNPEGFLIQIGFSLSKLSRLSQEIERAYCLQYYRVK